MITKLVGQISVIGLCCLAKSWKEDTIQDVVLGRETRLPRSLGADGDSAQWEPPQHTNPPQIFIL